MSAAARAAIQDVSQRERAISANDNMRGTTAVARRVGASFFATFFARSKKVDFNAKINELTESKR